MKWNLKKIYASLSDWQKDFDKIEKEYTGLSKFQGKLSNYEDFKKYNYLKDDIITIYFKVYMYAMLNSHLDLTNVENDSKFKSVNILGSKFSEVTSWEDPEILSIGLNKILDFCSKDKRLEPLTVGYKELYRLQEHVLSDKEEKIMTNMSPASAATRFYNSLAVSDYNPKTIKLSDNSEVEVTSQNFSALISDAKNAPDRKLIFETAFSHFAEHKTTYASIYNSIMQNSWAFAKSRGYNSVLEGVLDSNNIPKEVYTNLCEISKKNTDCLKRYYKIRKDYLKLDTHHTYDRFLNINTGDTKKYSYETSKKLFFESITSMSKDFIDKQHKALDEDYVDVNQAKGKIGGAYSMSVYGVHPYILLNHDETIRDLFTVAHEAGHSAHSLFSNEDNQLPTANYAIFVAEIASTFNEHLLLDHMLDKATDKKEKIALLVRAIDDIAGTFYRQTLFADYELQAHTLVEKGMPITHQSLSDIMIDLYKKYYDIDITQEEGKQYVWAYIPHFFSTSYYVYQYATSYAASLKLFEDIRANKANAEEKYIELLKSGCRKQPVQIVKDAGVDLTKKDPFIAVVNRMNELLDELEKVLK